MASNYGGLDEREPNPVAEGGAIPDDDDALGSNAGVQDDTTSDLSGALQIVQQALMFGRQKHGLPGGGGSSDNSEPAPQQQSGIPNDDEESYGGGGSIEDDIQASNNATDDGPQYGRPEVVDDPEAVRPPISSGNADSNVPEQTAIPQETAAALPGQDESGALPATPAVTDESGAGPAIPAPPAQQAQTAGIPDDPRAPHMMLRNLVLSYLQSADAMPNDQALAIERSVAPAAKNDPAAVPVLATAAAGSPEQQFAYIQRNRQIYDVAMAHGRAALSGVEGRPPSLDVAVQDASKAFSNVPDGENVNFVKHGDGVVAQVSGASGREQRGYPLTIEQFGQLLDTGKAGMFDRMMEPGGVRKVLGSFAQQQAPQTDGAATNPYLQGRVSQSPRGGIPADDNDDIIPGPLGVGDAAGRRGALRSRADSDRETTMGHDMTLLKASPQYKQQNPDWGKSSEVLTTPEQRREMFLNPEERAQRDKLEQIRAHNEGKGTIDDKKDLETLKIEGRQKVAETSGKFKTQHEDRLDARSAANRESREKIHAAQVDAKLKQIAEGSKNQHERTLAADIRTVRMNGGKLTPVQEQFLARVDQQFTQQPQQQAPQQQQQQAVPPAEQREIGRTYTSPDGRQGVWTGKGWRLVQ